LLNSISNSSINHTSNHQNQNDHYNGIGGIEKEQFSLDQDNSTNDAQSTKLDQLYKDLNIKTEEKKKNNSY